MQLESLCLRVVHGENQKVYPILSNFLLAGSGKDCDIFLFGENLPEVLLRLTVNEDGFRVVAVDQKFQFKVDGTLLREGFFRSGSALEISGNVITLEPTYDNTVEKISGKILRSEKVLGEISRLYRMVETEGNLQFLLTEALQGLQAILGGDNAFVFTLDSAGSPSLFVALSDAKNQEELFSDTVVQQALQVGKTIRVENALADPRFALSKSVVSLKLRSILCCPIQVAGKTRGLFYLGSNSPTTSFDEEDQKICELYTALSGTLIHHLAYISQQRDLIKTLSVSDGLGIVGSSALMRRVLEDAEAVADSSLNVLLLGESGTGKDLMAHFLHRKSSRRDKPFLVLNCGTLRGEMLASELFGHRRGAFTGAVADSRGLFLSAHGGTLFLDEIGELELPLQASLLRAIETGRIKPVGQAHEETADVRIVCATNRHLEDMVRSGQFREDLFYRINQHALKLPPLRDRGEDIYLLGYHFLNRARVQYPNKPIADFGPNTLSRMRQYSWPGNIRELGNAVIKAVILARTPLIELDFPEKVGGWISMGDAVRKFQREYTQKTLDACGGDKEKAAAMLDVARSTLFNYLSEARQVST